MKKCIALILVLMLCLAFCACGDSADTPGTTDDINNGVNGEVDNGNSENNNVDADWIVRGEKINVIKFREVIEIVELTTDNWKENFKVYSYSYTEEKVEKDDFGEIVSTETITHNGRAFGAGNERYHWYDEVVIELKNTATGELSIFKFGAHEEPNDMSVDEDFNLDNYECTRIKGCIYYINFAVGELPVDTFLESGFPEVDGMLSATLLGALRVIPGTNAIHHDYLKGWLS